MCINSCGDVEGAMSIRHRMLSSIWIKDQCNETLKELKFDKKLQSECPFRCPVNSLLFSIVRREVGFQFSSVIAFLSGGIRAL